VDGWVDEPEGQTVGLGDIINVVGRNHGPRAGHVLHDDIGISGNMFAQILRHKATPVILGSTYRVPHDEPDRLALKKLIRRCMRKVREKGKPDQERYAIKDSFHKTSLTSQCVERLVT